MQVVECKSAHVGADLGQGAFTDMGAFPRGQEGARLVRCCDRPQRGLDKPRDSAVPRRGTTSARLLGHVGRCDGCLPVGDVRWRGQGGLFSDWQQRYGLGGQQISRRCAVERRQGYHLGERRRRSRLRPVLQLAQALPGEVPEISIVKSEALVIGVRRLLLAPAAHMSESHQRADPLPLPQFCGHFLAAMPLPFHQCKQALTCDPLRIHA
jgi:hypothetical protein